MSALVLAEHDNHTLKHSTLHTLSAAKMLHKEVDIIVAGHNCQKVCESAASIAGVRKVIKADAFCYAHQLAENLAPLVAEIGKEYQYILAPATTFGKNILPRAAALLDVSMISDVLSILADDIFVRPMYAGNALATVQSTEAIKILTIRCTAFSSVETTSNKLAAIEVSDLVYDLNISQFSHADLNVSTRPDLTAARVVIAGGRGLKSAENFRLLEALAITLNAAIGASRAAVDAGFAPNDYQIGQTGKVVAPELYIAIGISGAIQHVAGMKDSKIIVAINSDPEAPIFNIADYGLVADLFSALKELQTELQK